MIEKIKELLIKYRELVLYLIVGVMTTIVSWGTYGLLKFVLDVENNAFQMQVAVILRWAAGVVFSYVASRKYVFLSKNPSIIKEFTAFTASRVVTLLSDMFMMWILPPFLVKCGVPYADWIATFISAVIVIVLNYIFSKLIVFRKKKTS